MRLNIFEKNYELVEKMNANPSALSKHNLNKFADLTNEEFSRHGGFVLD